VPRSAIQIALVAIGVFAAAFVYMHTGARAERLCNAHAFSGSGVFSLWPPGVRCAGGDPEIERTYFDPVFILPAVAILMLAGAALALRQSGTPGR
jgi:hypothetical protein